MRTITMIIAILWSKEDCRSSRAFKCTSTSKEKRLKRVSSVQIVSLFLKASKLGQTMLNVICIWCSFFFFNKYGLTLMVPKTITYYIMGLLIKNKCVLNWHYVREFWDKKWQLNPSTNSLQVKNSFCIQGEDKRLRFDVIELSWWDEEFAPETKKTSSFNFPREHKSWDVNYVS